MNEPQWNQEAETFARVWQRVSPDLDASPSQPAPLPALPPGAPRPEVLRELRCHVWYLPLSDRRPANHRPPQQQISRTGYSALFHGAQALQVRYEGAARQAQPPELALFRSAVEELTQEQRVLLGLMSRHSR